MQKEGKVSLWLGIFNDEETFRKFMEIKYTDDGDLIPSKFKKQFKIDYYDIDFSEIDYMEEKSNDLQVLLEGFSNDYEIIPRLNEKYSGGMYNSIVLLYDFEYQHNGDNYKNGDNELKFIGCVDYSK
ncbi:immunity 22 family protein [Clostridium cibarium]|uniref:Immunity 22 family protein n=1 Tax=Clostridium cibarium TaxID=2762247 RepID=A0ABR8PVR2_9CLOT|nr:immunity 22 family protein [Clostridium cibarium]MBD7912240.1 immunity 22 family protein [Clostridium cibarium]